MSRVLRVLGQSLNQSARTFDIGLHEVCVPVGGRAGVRYVITKFSRLDSLPNFLNHGAPRERAPLKSSNLLCYHYGWQYTMVKG